jgi:predicted RNA binding protein YcfA (HicA-like mRNA interferase family)
MPPVGPIGGRELIEYMRELGFTGPFHGTRHQFMSKGTLKVHIPNPHARDIGVGLLPEILKQAGISKDAWSKL